MLKFVPGRFHTGLSAWALNSIQCGSEAEIRKNCTVLKQYNKNSHFCRCCSAVIGCCTSEEKWKEVIRFFIEYGTVAMLEKRTEQRCARSVTDLSYQNNLHDRCRLLASSCVSGS